MEPEVVSLAADDRGDDIPTDDSTTADSDDSASPDTSPFRKDFRARYLQKLAYSQVWVPAAHRPPKHQTVIIFDWDDTLIPTTWLHRYEHKQWSPSIEASLRDSARKAQKLLELAVSSGHTFIITNAQSGWVELSCAKWAPELLPVLQQVQIISARSKFEPYFPHDVDRWKVEAFLEVQRQLDSTIITNLIALGDSSYEMNAAATMGSQFEKALLKTLKFQQTPTPIELLKQVGLVLQKFERIVATARPMKIFLEKR
jgi:hypothetical protein